MTRSRDDERQVLDTKDLPEEWQELLREQIAKDAEKAEQDEASDTRSDQASQQNQ